MAASAIALPSDHLPGFEPTMRGVFAAASLEYGGNGECLELFAEDLARIGIDVP